MSSYCLELNNYVIDVTKIQNITDITQKSDKYEFAIIVDNTPLYIREKDFDTIKSYRTNLSTKLLNLVYKLLDEK